MSANEIIQKICFGNKLLIYYPYPPAPLSQGKGNFTGATAPRPCRGLRPCDPFFNSQELFRQTESREYLIVTHGFIVFNFYGSYISP